MNKNKQQEPEEVDMDNLFDCTMKKDWSEVLRVYKSNPDACKAKLTRSKETALHIAVSSSHGDEADADKHAKFVGDLVESIGEEQAVEILTLKNDKGDTPLHLAAALGSVRICECIAGKAKELINNRNLKGETPLFLAAHHGKTDAFTCLHKIYNDSQEADDSLCRRMDGNTILHSAISGEYFGVIVHENKKQPSYPTCNKISPCCVNVTYYPDNYSTCMKFFSLPWAAFRLIFSLGKDSGRGGTDEENPNETGKRFSSTASFPPNYATGILLVKLLMNILLTIFGMSIWRIDKIKEKKERYRWAAKTMTKLIEHEATYKYNHDGQAPTQEMEHMYAERFVPPLTPPQDHDLHLSMEEHTSGGRKFRNKEPESDRRPETDITEKVEKKGEKVGLTNNVKKETPVLLAAKMGITEMVKMILEKFPVAIQDLDINEKNVLLLAVENRQTEVYDSLMKMKLPEFVLYQVDDEGNSAVHLAAKFQKHQPWRIPGAALQMQWEIKWYKHVKHTMPPQCFIQYNKNGETANEIFRKTHEKLVKDGNEWLTKTSESCSLVAALIATVAFASCTTVPGGLDQDTGHPILEKQPGFIVFSLVSIAALCFSVTALVYFLAILTSRCQQRDFIYDLPRKLLFGLSSLFTSIAAMLISFCAGHFFLLKNELQSAAYPIYTVACLPITFFAFAQLPLYFDLLWSINRKVPLRSYKVFYH